MLCHIHAAQLWSIEPKVDWNPFLLTIESKNLVAIMIVSNSANFTPVVETVCVPPLHDLVAGLEDEDVEPDAEVGGDHVHEAEARHELALVDVHLLVEEDEVHLDEDEKHLLDAMHDHSPFPP